jgi:molybdopterin biosynthesis enzyme
LVAKVDRSPRLCAGVLLLIEQRLRYAQVSYELFDEIADKEFVVETQRYISTHTSRLLSLRAANALLIIEPGTQPLATGSQVEALLVGDVR